MHGLAESAARTGIHREVTPEKWVSRRAIYNEMEGAFSGGRRMNGGVDRG
jgi:hypothetical protein